MNEKKSGRNIGLKLAALFFAAVLWILVVKIDDPVRISTFRNIPVSVINTDIVTNKGKTCKVIDEHQTVNVTVKARRKILSRISADKIVATADMNALQLESLIPVTVSILGFEGKYTAEAKPSNLRVSIEESVRKVFPVTAVYSGDPREGHIIPRDMLEPNLEKITIRGPESVVSSIDTVMARVDVTGVSRSGYLASELIFYDRKGNVVNKSQLSNNAGERGVTVYVTVLDTKDVPVIAKASGTPAEGYLEGRITCEPEVIRICGMAADLGKVESIEIPPEAIDITGGSGRMEVTVDISQYLPEGISLPDEKTSNAVVTIFFEKEGERVITVKAESLNVWNLSPELDISFDIPDDIELHFRGKKENLEALDVTEAVSIDMSSYNTVGKYEIPVTVDLGEAEDVALVGNPSVKATVTRRK